MIDKRNNKQGITAGAGTRVCIYICVLYVRVCMSDAN